MRAEERREWHQKYILSPVSVLECFELSRAAAAAVATASPAAARPHDRDRASRYAACGDDRARENVHNGACGDSRAPPRARARCSRIRHRLPSARRVKARAAEREGSMRRGASTGRARRRAGTSSGQRRIQGGTIRARLAVRSVALRWPCTGAAFVAGSSRVEVRTERGRG